MYHQNAVKGTIFIIFEKCYWRFLQLILELLLCHAVACPHLERSGMGTACSRSASAHLYHAGSRLLPCDGAAD